MNFYVTVIVVVICAMFLIGCASRTYVSPTGVCYEILDGGVIGEQKDC